MTKEVSPFIVYLMVSVENVSRYFGEKCAVRNVSFSINEGDTMVLLGPNGAGKTTIIRLLSSVLIPDSGKIKIYNYDVEQQPKEVRKIIGVVGELTGLYQRMNLREYLLYFGQLYGVSAKKVESITDSMAEILNLKEEMSYPIETYSKGTKQKVSLIRALLHSPPVIFLDEPTSAMDPHSAKIVRDYIRRLSEEKKIILVCTHNMMEAEYLAEKVAIIKKGEIKFIGKTTELKNTSTLNLYQLTYQPEVPLKGQNLEKLFDIKIKSEGRGCFTFEVQDGEAVNPYLIKYLVEKNIKIISCSLISTTLEEAYLDFEK